MTEQERIEEEIVTIIADNMHQQFSQLIDAIKDATPMQVLRWVKLSETPYDQLGNVEKICYMKMAMVELDKIRPLLQIYQEGYVNAKENEKV